VTCACLKQIIYEIFENENPDPNDKAKKFFDWIIIIFILLSIFSIILETIPWVHSQKAIMQIMAVVEIASVAVFTTEYLLRFWCITVDPRYSHPLWGRLRFLFTFMSIVDLMAITPFYITSFMHFKAVDLRFVRILRLVRLFRVLKLARYSSAMQNIFRVIQLKKADILVTLSIVILLILLSSSLMFFVEHEAQPDKFISIPDSMWWAVCTLTTVGYGDIFPITWLGKVITAFITLLSIGLIALPAGIIVSGYQEISAQKVNKEKLDENKLLEKRIENIESMLSEIRGKIN